MATAPIVLRGVGDVSRITLIDNLRSNMIEFFNWGFLCAGGFNNVQIGTNFASGAYGGDFSVLRCVSDPNYSLGQVWEGFRQDWVWESGVTYSLQPIQVSGVWVNNIFHPLSGVGTYAHFVNYPWGRIVFNNPIPKNSKVQANFSYRLFSFQSSEQTWFKELMFNSYRVDDPQFLQQGSGIWNVLAENRVQLPAIVVNVVPRRVTFGYELGGTDYVHQDVVFHILAENSADRDTLIDCISYQQDKTIPTFDKNSMAQANAFPLDYNGSIAPGSMCFPDLVSPSGQGGFFWKTTTFLRTVTQDVIAEPPLFQAKVRATMELTMMFP